MTEVIWSALALRDLNEIQNYIQQFDPIAAKILQDRLRELGDSLVYAPARGGSVPRGARELVSVQPYILRYRAEGDTVVIVRVRHSRRHSLG